MAKIRLHILIPTALRKELDRIALRDGVTMTAVVIHMLWKSVRAEAA